MPVVGHLTPAVRRLPRTLSAAPQGKRVTNVTSPLTQMIIDNIL